VSAISSKSLESVCSSTSGAIVYRAAASAGTAEPWRERGVCTYEREDVAWVSERPLRDVVDVEVVSVCRVGTDDLASLDRVPVLAKGAERGVDAREPTRELLLPGVARQRRPVPAGVFGC